MTFLNHDMPVFDSRFAQAQMQPAPARQHCAAVQAAAEHGALVIDIGFKRQLQTQLPVLPAQYLETHFPGQRDVVMKN